MRGGIMRPDIKNRPHFFLGRKKIMKKLIVIRKEKNLSQFDLARLSGISITRISLIEREKDKANFIESEMLSKALKVKADEINWPTT